jgi:hypothetical protein
LSSSLLQRKNCREEWSRSQKRWQSRPTPKLERGHLKVAATSFALAEEVFELGAGAGFVVTVFDDDGAGQ